MLGCAPAGKARHREIGAAPEVMHRAAFAREARPELIENALRLQQRAPVSIGVLGIVRAVRFIPVERNRVGQLVGHRANGHRHLERLQGFHEPPVERRHRLRLERQARLTSVAHLNPQAVLHEIELHLERLRAVGHEPRREPPRRYRKRDMPGVVGPGKLHQRNLSDDLQPQVQRRAGLAPGFVGQDRPACRAGHGRSAAINRARETLREFPARTTCRR